MSRLSAVVLVAVGLAVCGVAGVVAIQGSSEAGRAKAPADAAGAARGAAIVADLHEASPPVTALPARPAAEEPPSPRLRIKLNVPRSAQFDAKAVAWQLIGDDGRHLLGGSNLEDVPRTPVAARLVLLAYGFEPALVRVSESSTEVSLSLRPAASSATLDFSKVPSDLRAVRATVAESVDAVGGDPVSTPLTVSTSIAVGSGTERVEIPITLGSSVSVELLQADRHFVLPAATVLFPSQTVAVEVERLCETRIAAGRVEGDRVTAAELPSALCFPDAWSTSDADWTRADSIQWWAFRQKPQIEREGAIGVLRTPKGSAWHCALTDGLDSGYAHIDGTCGEVRAQIGRRQLAASPRVGGTPLVGEFVIVPGKLDPTTAAQLLRFPAYQGRIWVRVPASGGASTLPEAAEYTIVQDGRRFATVRWDGSELVGEWAPGSLVVQMPKGWQGEAEISLQTAAPGSGTIRTGVAVPILESRITSESLELDALPLGQYSAQVTAKSATGSLGGIMPFGLSISAPKHILVVSDKQLEGRNR